MNCMIYNLCEQRVQLSAVTWNAIIEQFYVFGGNQQSQRRDQIRLELIYNFSTVPAGIYYESTPWQQRGDMTRDEFFERQLLYVVNYCIGQTDIASPNYGLTLALREDLKKKPILSAIKRALNNLPWNDLCKSSITDIWMTNEIDRMAFFVSQLYGAYRGSVLTDGVMICELALSDASCSNSPRFNADRLTLVANLTAHYLARKVLNDFMALNMNGFRQTNCGVDVEVELFGGCQIDWFVTIGELAEQFLEKVKKEDDLPLLNPEQQFMRPRRTEGLPFAGDLKYLLVLRF